MAAYPSRFSQRIPITSARFIAGALLMVLRLIGLLGDWEFTADHAQGFWQWLQTPLGGGLSFVFGLILIIWSIKSPPEHPVFSWWQRRRFIKYLQTKDTGEVSIYAIYGNVGAISVASGIAHMLNRAGWTTHVGIAPRPLFFGLRIKTLEGENQRDVATLRQAFGEINIDVLVKVEKKQESEPAPSLMPPPPPFTIGGTEFKVEPLNFLIPPFLQDKRIILDIGYRPPN